LTVWRETESRGEIALRPTPLGAELATNDLQRLRAPCMKRTVE
jgi:hypothetical protein